METQVILFIKNHKKRIIIIVAIAIIIIIVLFNYKDTNKKKDDSSYSINDINRDSIGEAISSIPDDIKSINSDSIKSK